MSHKRNIPSESIVMADELLLESVYNERGVPDGKTPRRKSLEDNMGDSIGRDGIIAVREDEMWEHFFMPTIEHQLTQPGSSLTGFSIMQDINAEVIEGKGLLPYTHPVGVLPRRVRPKRLTDIQVTKVYNQRKEEERAALLKRQARNDETLTSLMRKR